MTDDTKPTNPDVAEPAVVEPPAVEPPAVEPPAVEPPVERALAPAEPVEPEPEPAVEPAVEPEPAEVDPTAAIAPPPAAAAVEPEPAVVEPVPAVVEPVPAVVEPEPAEAAPPAVELAPAPIQLEPREPSAEDVTPSLTRRAFLGAGLTFAGGLLGAGVLSRLVPVFDEPTPPPIVPTYDPASKAWTFVVDSASCIGCGMCVVACKDENHVPEEPAYTRTWIERHSVATDGTEYVDAPAGGINGFPPRVAALEADGKALASSFFEPRLCMQCENSPCTSVCPVGATYRTVDGVILVDAERCIGCGYCVVACPYGARYIVPASDRTPDGVAGVADKCTWCYHRISQNRLPACVEVCPVGARKFGDASDPDSEIATIVRTRQPRMLHPEYGTRPRVLYLGPAVEEA